MDVDFAVGGMLKYLLGTAGLGFMYVRDSFVKSLLPTNSGWFAQTDIGAMDITANRPAPSARRFEAGTPAVVNSYASEAGLKILLAVGTPAIEKRVYALTRRCMQRLEEIGWPSITPTRDDRRGATVVVAERTSGQAKAVGRNDIHSQKLVIVLAVDTSHEVDWGIKCARVANLAGGHLTIARFKGFGGHRNSERCV